MLATSYLGLLQVRQQHWPYGRAGIWNMIVSLFRRSPSRENRKIVDRLYEDIVAAARRPVFYESFGIPDTPLGRYESLCVHMIVFLHRTRNASAPLSPLAQDVLDEFFHDVDHSIRELGVGDPGVPKRMKKLARMFYGRMEHYWKALDARDRNALGEALVRNIVVEDGEQPIEGGSIADYMLDAADALADQSDDTLLSGSVSFPEVNEKTVAR